MLKFNKRMALEALQAGLLHDFFNAQFVAAVLVAEKEPKTGVFQLQALFALFDDEALNDQLQHWQYQSKIAYKIAEIHSNLKEDAAANEYFKISINLDFAHDALPHPFTMYQYAKTLQGTLEEREKAYVEYMAVAAKHGGELSEDTALAIEDTADFYAKTGQEEKALETYKMASLLFAQLGNVRAESIKTKMQSLLA